MGITAVNNHGGVVSDEVRLILVVQKETGMPVFMRYVPGNVNDASTLVRTMTELGAQGVGAAYALIDSGYFTGPNVNEMYEAGLDFMTRLPMNLNLYKDLKEEILPDIRTRENFTLYNDRKLFIRKAECELAPGRKGYAYAVLDTDRKYLEDGRGAAKAKAGGMSDAEAYDSMADNGFFVLASNMDIPNKELLPTYYVRQVIEQFIDVGKNYTGMLPLRVHSEETFRGHILVSFIAAAVVQRLQNSLKDKGEVKGRGKNKGRVLDKAPTVTSALMSLRNQKCKVYDDTILPCEAQAIANKAYTLLGIDVPYAIPLKNKGGG